MSSDVILQPRQEIEPPSTRAEDDPRRAGSVVVSLRSDGNGTLTVDGEMWGAVEWSEKHGVWCIEDAEGQCLNHTASIRGRAESREEAIAFAEQMIREGTMPSPEEARRLHRERLERQREQRDKQPAEIRKAQAREEESRLLTASFAAERTERAATPFYETFAEAFDLADPDLWRSNSFAMLRPRLLVEVRAAVAGSSMNSTTPAPLDDGGEVEGRSLKKASRTLSSSASSRGPVRSWR